MCGKPDWCCLGTLYANCMRVESSKPCDNGGYLHPLDSKPIDPIIIQRPAVESPPLKAEQMHSAWARQTHEDWIDALRSDLHVSRASLVALRAAWAAPHNAWAFPMYDGYGTMIGIRLRTSEGKKFAVTGSRQGLFLAQVAPRAELWICEGPTDTAAALTLGLFVIGRPSCLGAEDHISNFVRLWKVRRVVICADKDEPGQRGAEKLQSVLRVPSMIFTPPAKDLRAAVAAGLTSEMLKSMTKDVILTPAKHIPIWMKTKNEAPQKY